MIYYGIEEDIIHQSDIIKKHSLRLPSAKVQNILDKLLDQRITNVFDVFDMFKE
jgi:hypothetical protein